MPTCNSEERGLVGAKTAPVYTVAVRNLCEFTAKQGDLDLRFTPAPTAMQGMAGHAEVTARRGPLYQREVTLTGNYLNLQVRGRADGYNPQLNRLEEIKTHRGDIARLPDNHRQLHWAQAKVYAWLMCQQRDLADIEVSLVYFDIGSQKETCLTERHAAGSLQSFFEMLCQRFLQWADQETAHRNARDAALLTMGFPHADFRIGQRTLATNVYKANVSARCLLAQAPTGIGKTIGCVFAALKAMPGQRLDKLFYLTAKTPGRQLAMDALELLHKQPQNLPLRVLELVARDKACEHPDKACHGDSCPLAKGFYDRLPAARVAAAKQGALGKFDLRELALSHSVCPYYLGQEMVRWSDVVVGDYNHYFDLSAQLFAHTVQEEWRVSVLADEAHNLVERGRKMYSTELHHDQLQSLGHHAVQLPVVIKKALTQVHRQWTALLTDRAGKPVGDYQILDALPEKFVLSLQKLSAEIAELFAQEPTRIDPALQAFHFDALHFLRLAELFGSHSLFDISRPKLEGTAGLALRGDGHGLSFDNGDSTLCIRNLVPAPHLKERWVGAQSATLFSATLTPAHYLLEMLGLPDTTAWVDVPSAFGAHQLKVTVAQHISTRWRDRTASLGSLVDVMAHQYRRAPGNYLAFFSSFDYLQTAADELMVMHPDIPAWQQTRRMNEPERDAFLARFTAEGQGIGFAVLGGAFGEGIDLPGARLIGAFIATLGMVQVNPVNEALRQRVGYDFTYLYPGIQKVVQAAGRVIRTVQDQGVVILMDDRFAKDEVRSLLPNWWQIDWMR